MLLVEVGSCFQLDQQQLLSIKVKLMLPWFTLVVQGIIYSGSKSMLLNTLNNHDYPSYNTYIYIMHGR